MYTLRNYISRRQIAKENLVTIQIEIFDEKRKQYRGGGLIGSVVFFIFWIGYVILMLSGQTMDILRTILLAILILSILLQAYFAVRSISLEWKIKKDPILQEALNNELIQYHELQAWRASFFSMVAFIILAAITSIFVRIHDPMLIFLTILVIGFGTHNAAVYILDR